MSIFNLTQNYFITYLLASTHKVVRTCQEN
jgi:hypothetical protein